MILKKTIDSKFGLYFIEINTNDEYKNIITLYTKDEMDILMQNTLPKFDSDDYIQIAKDTINKYEHGDKTKYSKFSEWHGYINNR